MKGETVRLNIEIPEKLYDVFTWYLKKTSYWVCNDWEKKTVCDTINQLIKDYLEMEAGHPTDAEDCLKEEFKHKLDYLG